MGQYCTGHLVKVLLSGDITCIKHLVSTISTMKQAMLVKQPTLNGLQNRRVTLPSSIKGRKTLLLELDETFMVVRTSEGVKMMCRWDRNKLFFRFFCGHISSHS